MFSSFLFGPLTTEKSGLSAVEKLQG